MKIRVVNEHTHGRIGTFIGRPSPLGNPFVIGRDDTREDVIQLYHRWLRQQWQTKGPARKELLKLARQAKKEGGIVLRCYCAPQACHGDIVATAIRKVAERL
jgi:hypothetical protein